MTTRKRNHRHDHPDPNPMHVRVTHDTPEQVAPDAFVITSQAFLDGMEFGRVMEQAAEQWHAQEGKSGPVTERHLRNFLPYCTPLNDKGLSPLSNAGQLFGWLLALYRCNTRYGPVPESFAHLTFECPAFETGYWQGFCQVWESPLTDQALTDFLQRELSAQMIETLRAHSVEGVRTGDHTSAVYSMEQAQGYVSGTIIGRLTVWPVVEHITPPSEEEEEQAAEQMARMRENLVQRGLATRELFQRALMVGEIGAATRAMERFSPDGRDGYHPYTVRVLTRLVEQMTGRDPHAHHASLFDPDITRAFKRLLRAIKQAERR